METSAGAGHEAVAAGVAAVSQRTLAMKMESEATLTGISTPNS